MRSVTFVSLFALMGVCTAGAIADDPQSLQELKEATRYKEPAPKSRILVSIHEVDPADTPIEYKDYSNSRAMLADEYQAAVNGDVWCTGNACDVYMPVAGGRYADVSGQKRLNSALAGVAGALMGEEIAGAPGAVFLGVLGAAAGYRVTDKARWEREARYYEAAYQRGDDLFYNPAHRIPDQPQWLTHGPGSDKK